MTNTDVWPITCLWYVDLSTTLNNNLRHAQGAVPLDWLCRSNVKQSHSEADLLWTTNSWQTVATWRTSRCAYFSNSLSEAALDRYHECITKPLPSFKKRVSQSQLRNTSAWFITMLHNPAMSIGVWPCNLWLQNDCQQSSFNFRAAVAYVYSFLSFATLHAYTRYGTVLHQVRYMSYGASCFLQLVTLFCTSSLVAVPATVSSCLEDSTQKGNSELTTRSGAGIGLSYDTLQVTYAQFCYCYQ